MRVCSFIRSYSNPIFYSLPNAHTHTIFIPCLYGLNFDSHVDDRMSNELWSRNQIKLIDILHFFPLSPKLCYISIVASFFSIRFCPSNWKKEKRNLVFSLFLFSSLSWMFRIPNHRYIFTWAILRNPNHHSQMGSKWVIIRWLYLSIFLNRLIFGECVCMSFRGRRIKWPLNILLDILFVFLCMWVCVTLLIPTSRLPFIQLSICALPDCKTESHDKLLQTVSRIIMVKDASSNMPEQHSLICSIYFYNIDA